MSQQTQHQPSAQPTGQIDRTLDQPPPLSIDQTNAEPPPTAPESEPPPFNPGLPRTFGRYHLLEILGQGGMGVVYKAKQAGLDRIVALKMILSAHGASAHAIARFRREAQAASSLDHAHIVPLYDFGEEHGQPFYTMAFIEGETLHHMVERGGPPPPEEAVRLMLGLAAAVGYAHRKGLIHRDLKPDNILIDHEGNPRILDFGLARLIEGDRLTADGQILGTPSYMSPEQARGDSNLGPATDVYALGAVLYYVLTGRRPFEGDSPLQTLIRVAHETPVPPRQVNFKVPMALEAVCMKCLEKVPEERYVSAEELAAALRAAEENPSAPPAPSSTAVIRPSVRGKKRPATPRRRWVGIVAGLGAVLALGAGAVFLATHKKTAATSQPETTTLAEPQDPLLPKELVQDFGLKVEAVGDKGEALAQAGGRYSLKSEAPIRLKVTVEREAYVGVWNYSESGTITQLFPNEDEPDYLLKPGKVYFIPGDGGSMTPHAAQRPEHLRVIAATEKWEGVSGSKAGAWLVFKTPEERQRVADLTRDLTHNRKKKPDDPKAPQVSEAVVPYWVK